MIFDAWRALGMTGKIIAGAVGLAVAGLVLWAVWNVVDAPRRAREAEMQSRTATAYSASSRAAIDVVVAASKRDVKTQEVLTDEVAKIQQLPEELRYGATLDLLCGMHEYRSDPRCSQLRKPGP